MINTAAQTGLVNESTMALIKTVQTDRPGKISQNRSLRVRLRNILNIINLLGIGIEQR